MLLWNPCARLQANRPCPRVLHSQQLRAAARDRSSSASDEVGVDASPGRGPVQVATTSAPSAHDGPSHAAQPVQPMPVSGNGQVLEARQITALITASTSMDQLQEVVHAHGARMNGINTAAAVVKLSKLLLPAISEQHSMEEQATNEAHTDPGTSEGDDRAHSHAAASTSGRTENGHARTAANASSSSHGRSPSTAKQRSSQALSQPHTQASHDPAAMQLASDLCVQFAQQLADCSGARQCANVCWAMGRLGVQIPQPALQAMLHHLAANNGSRLRQSAPQELANLSWGLARLQHWQPGTWSLVCTAASSGGGKLLQGLKTQEAANLAWAAASACRQLQQQSSHEAAATLGQLQRAVEAIAGHATSHVDRFRTDELVGLLWACAAAGPVDGPLVAGLVRAAAPVLAHAGARGTLSAQDIGNSAWAVAKLHPLGPTHQLLASLCSCVQRRASQPGWSAMSVSQQPGALQLHWLPTQELCNVLWACAHSGYHHTDAALMHALCSELESRASHMAPQAVATATWAVAKLGLAHTGCMDAMLHAAARQAQAMDTQQLCNTIWGLAQGHAPSLLLPQQTLLLATLVQAVQARAQLIDPTGLAQLAWAAGRLSRLLHHQAAQSQRAASPAVSRDSSPAADAEAAQQHPQHRLHQALADMVVRQAMPKLDRFKATDLAALGQGLSYAQRGAADPLVFQAIADAAADHISAGLFAPSALASLLASFVRVQCRPRSLAAAAARAAAARPEAFELRHAANLLWALAALRIRDKPLLDRMTAALLHGPLGSQLECSSSSCSSMGSLASGSYDDDSLSALYTRPTQAAGHEQLHAQHSQGSFHGDGSWSHGPSEAAGYGSEAEEAELDWQGPELQAEALAEAAGMSLDEAALAGNGIREEGRASTPGMTWAVMAWSFARSSYHQHQLFDRLAAAVLQGLDDRQTVRGSARGRAQQQQQPGTSPVPAMTTTCLVQLVWAFAKHEHSHPALLQAMAPVLALRVVRGGLGPTQVACVAWGYAKLQHHAPTLFHAILNYAMKHKESYDLRSWSRLAWAFSTLSLPAEEAFFQRLSTLQRQHQEAAQAAAAASAAAAAQQGVSAGARRSRQARPGSAGSAGSGSRRVPAGAVAPAARSSSGMSSQQARQMRPAPKRIEEQDWMGLGAVLQVAGSFDEAQHLQQQDGEDGGGDAEYGRQGVSMRRELKRPNQPRQRERGSGSSGNGSGGPEAAAVDQWQGEGHRSAAEPLQLLRPASPNGRHAVQQQGDGFRELEDGPNHQGVDLDDVLGHSVTLQEGSRVAVPASCHAAASNGALHTNGGGASNGHATAVAGAPVMRAQSLWAAWSEISDEVIPQQAVRAGAE